jgi:ABC-type glycerol-3-phosphate transport system permease component
LSGPRGRGLCIAVSLRLSEDLWLAWRAGDAAQSDVLGASVLTPVATPAKIMVMVPAGYRFGDYWRFGLCLLVFFFLVSTFMLPPLWSF